MHTWTKFDTFVLTACLVLFGAIGWLWDAVSRFCYEASYILGGHYGKKED